jgi:putative membrane protein
MKLIYTIIITLIVLFVVTFSLQNTAMIPLKYYGFIEVETTVYLLIFVSFFAGIIIAGFFGIAERFRLTRAVKKLNKTVKKLEKELGASQSLTAAVTVESSDEQV